MSTQAYIDHILATTRLNLDFLSNQGVISLSDLRVIQARLPQAGVTPSIPVNAATSSVATRSASLNKSPATASPTWRSSTASIASTETKRSSFPPARNVPAPPSPAGPPAYSPQVQEQEGLTLAEALYDYNGTDDNDLSFTKGDKIVVLKYENDDWWMGKIQGNTDEGVFPSNYVKKIPYPPAGKSPVTSNKLHTYPRPPYAPAPSPANAYPPVTSSSSQQEIERPMTEEEERDAIKAGKRRQNIKDLKKQGAQAVVFGAGASIGSGIVRAIF